MRDATVTWLGTTRTVYVGVTLAQSKVKIKVMEYLNFRQLLITADF